MAQHPFPQPLSQTQTPSLLDRLYPSSTPPPTVPARPDPQVVLMDDNVKYVEQRHLRQSSLANLLSLSAAGTLGMHYICDNQTPLAVPRSSLSTQADTKVAERVWMVFAESRVVISTLLPHTDTPPHVIHDINMEMCSKLSRMLPSEEAPTPPPQPSPPHPAPPHCPHPHPPAPHTQRAPSCQQMTYTTALARPAPQPATPHVSELEEIKCIYYI